jgi:hypothetical protein
MNEDSFNFFFFAKTSAFREPIYEMGSDVYECL